MQQINKPIIGILGNVAPEGSGKFPGLENVYVNRDYVTAVLQAEGIPFILPFVEGEELVRAQIEMMDGILLSGGYDVHPALYGQEPHVKLEEVYPERDVYEIAVIKAAIELKKPIFGICRGLQLINVAFGGTLYQDLSLHQPQTEIQHNQTCPRDLAIHSIEVSPNSKLHKIFGTTQVPVNSFHHQAIDQLAPGLKINACSIDGVIEGIEKEGEDFFIAVQWHPERMVAKHPLMKKLFQAFTDAARRYRESHERKF